VHYEVPYGYWLLGSTVSGYDYFQTVAGASQAYRYSGHNGNGEIRLSRLLYRDAARKTGAYVRGWMRNADNFIDDTEIEVQRRRTAGWELGLTHREFIGGAILDASLAWRRGTGAMAALRAPEEGFGEGTSRLELLSAEAQLNVPFAMAGQRLRYAGTWRGQWNRTALTPQDRFAIGGRYTVRGFDGEMSLSGDRGWLWRNELAWMAGPAGLELYVGADYGEVGGRSAQWLLGRRLAGAVVGLRGRYKGLHCDVFAGKPLYKPAGFRTASTTAGFSLSWSY
jgi:hemolysin activation/secretion protein